MPASPFHRVTVRLHRLLHHGRGWHVTCAHLSPATVVFDVNACRVSAQVASEQQGLGAESPAPRTAFGVAYFADARSALAARGVAVDGLPRLEC